MKKIIKTRLAIFAFFGGMLLVVGCSHVNKAGSLKTSAESYAKPLLMMTEEGVEHKFVCYPQDILEKNDYNITVNYDMDKDGKEEEFEIRPGQLGPEVVCISGGYGMEVVLVEDSECIQLSFVDLDKDGKEEVVILFAESCSNGWVMDIYASVYGICNIPKSPFYEIGKFDSQQEVFMTKEGGFHCPVGFQGLFVEYIFHDGRIIEMEW